MTTRVTPSTDIDDAVSTLAARRSAWAKLDFATRLSLLTDLRRRTAAEAETWAETSSVAKGIPVDSPLAGEEWLSGPYAVLTYLRALHESITRLWRGRTTYDAGWVAGGPDGRTIVKTLPVELDERLLLSGYTAEVWMQRAVDPENLAGHTAGFYREESPEGQVALVLGAGNIAAIPPLDILHELFVKGRVVLLKMNPVNDYLGSTFERIFDRLIRLGYVRLVYGGSETGAYLTRHPGVDTIHVTGSEQTHDAIVFGAGDDGAPRKAANDPVLDKPITSELGGVSPLIVVPGPWSKADIDFQAEQAATQKLHNGGFTCISAQVLVVPDRWEHTDRYLRRVEEAITAQPSRPAYYPGADERIRAAALRHGDVIDLAGDLSRLHLRNTACDVDSFAFAEELFGSVLVSTRLPESDPGDFLAAAVTFANERLHGTLGAGILIHPRTAATLGDRFSRAVADLRYGCVGINVWTALGFLHPRATWGAYPGHTPDDIQSGQGVVHNALMFDRAEKTVVTGPFRPAHRSWRGGGGLHISPKPPWFITNRTFLDTARGLTRYAADGSRRHLPGIFLSAMRG